MAEKETFLAEPVLKALGVKEISEFSESGNLIVTGPDGQQKEISPEKILGLYGLKPGDRKIVWNSPESALNTSPVDTTDRLKMSFGNARGNLQFLKNKFEDAAYDPEQGLVVQKNGAWHRVDPELLGKGDAWEKTKELVKDLADVGSEVFSAAGQTAGAAGAGIVSGGVGSVAGAAAAGAATAKIKHVLGKAVGTYEPGDAQEELEEIGLEMLLAAGGQGVALGVKPGLDMLVKAGKNIGRWGSSTTKEALGGVVGQLTGTGPAATKALFENPGRITGLIKRYASGAADTAEAMNKVAQDKTAILENLLKEAPKALSKKYGENLDALVASAPEGLVVNFKGMVDDIYKEFEKIGLGKIVESGQGEEVTKRSLKLFGPKARTMRIAAGESTLPIEGTDQELINPLLRQLEQFKKGKSVVSGSKAAKGLHAFQQLMDDMVEPLFDQGSAPLKKAAMQIKGAYRNQVAAKFRDAGLETEFTNLTVPYIQYKDAVNVAQKALRSNDENAIEQLFNRFVSAPGTRSGSQTAREKLVDLLGENGAEQMDEALALHAAQKYLPKAPKIGLTSLFVGSGAGMGMGLPGLAVTAAASSPRVMAQAVRAGSAVAGAAQAAGSGAARVAGKAGRPFQGPVKYAYQGLDFMRNMTPPQVKAFLSDEQMAARLFQTLVAGNQLEQKQKAALMQEAQRGLQSALSQ